METIPAIRHRNKDENVINDISKVSLHDFHPGFSLLHFLHALLEVLRKNNRFIEQFQIYSHNLKCCWSDFSSLFLFLPAAPDTADTHNI